MTKVYERKTKYPYVNLQIRLKPQELQRLKVLCADLGMTVQAFIMKLLRNRTDGVLSPPRPEDMPTWVKAKKPEDKQ